METKNIFERYHRQVQLDEVGIHGQEKLKNSRILLIGTGGLGSPAAFYLAAAGVGTIGLLDDDVVDKTNLNRQILHLPESIGKPKVDSARNTLERFNPGLEIKTHKLRFNLNDKSKELINDYDLVLDCTDNYDTRYAINQACMDLQKPWIYGAVAEFEGQIMTIIPGQTPCYRCLYPSAGQNQEEICAVMGVAPGFIGIIQASEALKYLLNTGTLLSGRLLYVDLKDMHFDTLTVKRNKSCPTCKNI